MFTKIFFTTQLILLSSLLYANTKVAIINPEVKHLQQELKAQQEQLIILKGRIAYQEKEIDRNRGIIDTTFNSVSTQITASSLYITIIGMVLSLGTLGFGIWIKKLSEYVRQMVSDNEEISLKSMEIKKDVEDLSFKIINDTRGLYKLISNEESNYIIERLIQVPEDINNLCSGLLTRHLSEEHFIKLKEAYGQITDETYKEPYLTVFFQHFAGKAMMEPELKHMIFKNLDILVSNSFKNDIIKSTYDLFFMIRKKGLKDSIEEINSFAEAISASKYSILDDVYMTIYQVLEDRISRFELYRLIQKNEKNKNFILGYGVFLLDYETESSNSDEDIVLAEIKSLRGNDE